MISWTEYGFFYFIAIHTHPKICYFFLKKEFVGDCEDTLQEIKSLIDRLCARGEKIEKISIWLRGNLEELRFLATVEIPGE